MKLSFATWMALARAGCDPAAESDPQGLLADAERHEEPDGETDKARGG
jgi:hypothetical protein